MENYVNSAVAIFRMFASPERYAIESIRQKTETTLVWTIGYLFLMATLLFLFEGKDVEETGRGILVVLWGLSALTASLVLQFWTPTQELRYAEGALLYLTSLAGVLTGLVLGQLLTPYDQQEAGIGAALGGGILVYFFSVPVRRMLIVLVGDGTKVGIWKFIGSFLVAFAAWGTIVIILKHLLPEDLPLEHFLKKLP